MRAIDADKFKKLYESYARLDTTIRVKDILEDIDDMPTIEPRKKGVWTNDCCSICGYGVEPWNNTPYCPNCGADMRGEKE